MTKDKSSDVAVMVTGANSGIGRATAIRFASAGARVALVGRDRTRLNHVANEINSILLKTGNPDETRCFPIVGDVTIESEAKLAVTISAELRQPVRATDGRADVLPLARPSQSHSF